MPPGNLTLSGPTVIALVASAFFAGPLVLVDAMMLGFPLLAIGNVARRALLPLPLRRAHRMAAAPVRRSRSIARQS